MKIRKFAPLVIVAFGCQGLALREASAAAGSPHRAAAPPTATLPPTHEPTPEPIVVPAGTTLILVFESTVSSASARAGDVVMIIGGVAGAGAIIGGIAGGGAGLLKGVLIVGAAGTGGVLFIRGKEVVFEQGSRHSVTLERSLRLS